MVLETDKFLGVQLKDILHVGTDIFVLIMYTLFFIIITAKGALAQIIKFEFVSIIIMVRITTTLNQKIL